MVDGFVPSEWGRRYEATDAHETLGGGAAGVGKTWQLIADPFKQFILEHDRCLLPKSHDLYHPFPRHVGEPGDSLCWALFLRRTAPMLMQSIERAARMLRALDPNVVYKQLSGESGIFYLSSGARYEFGACRDLVSYERYMGGEYTWIGFDEVNQFDAQQYFSIVRRCRTTDPVLAALRRRRAMGNPVLRREGESFTVHNPYWAREYFVDPAPGGNRLLKRKLVMEDGSVEYWTRIFLPARLSDNPDPMFRRQYEIELKGSGGPEHITKALLTGNWYLTADSFYTELDAKIHWCKPFKVPRGWRVFRSMDWGYKLPGIIGWWAQSPDDDLVLIREWMFQGRTDREVAAGIQERERKMGFWDDNYGSKLDGPADTQIWEERGEHGVKTKAQTFLDLGVKWSKAAKGPGSRKKNAQLLVQKLKDKDPGAPGFRVFDICPETYKNLSSVQTDENDLECPADTKRDHPHDMVLYAVAYSSRGLGSVDGDDEDVGRCWAYDDGDEHLGTYGA